MIQYTTPTLTVRVKNVALTNTDEVWLTLQPHDTQVLKGEPLTIEDPSFETDGDDTLVSVKLTQAQSASLATGSVWAQVNWLSTDGTRGATKRTNFSVELNLLDEVLPQAGV